MKRRIVFLLLATAIAAIFIIRSSTSFSDEERQKRADDSARLLATLRSVGYEQDFALRTTDSLEQNLRRLMLDRSFNDGKKNAELLISLESYDFIAEGLRSKALSHPYYSDWPRDPSYRRGSELASFDSDETLWLLLLLAQADDLPQPHAELRDVLVQSGVAALGHSIYAPIWVYFECTSPGLLAQFAPDFFGAGVSIEILDAFRAAGVDIQNQLMAAVDVEEDVRNSPFRPTFCPTFAEAEELMGAYPPTGSWEGGYLRIVDPPSIGGATAERHLNTRSADVYKTESHKALTPVTNPAHARFAIYEEYTDPVYYSTYTFMGNGRTSFDAYIWNLHIRIVDLLSGEEIFRESTLGNPPPEELSFYVYFTGSQTHGGYHHNDFDYDRYAAVMLAHMNDQG